MPPEIETLERPALNKSRPAKRDFSLFLRRCHMYLGLFLTPWLLMYALSTVVFNHWEGINRLYDGRMDEFRVEREIPYYRAFPSQTDTRGKGEQILRDLNLTGSFGVDDSEKDRIVISRRDPITPRRVTFFPGRHRLVIERQAFRTPNFLTTVHSQVGYINKLKRIRIWAATVDLTAISTVMLVLSGFWMWWELKATRGWGLAFSAAGFGLFALFLGFA